MTRHLVEIDPLTSLSDNFRLLDFLGCESVYRQGYRNVLEGTEEEVDLRMRNLTALCEQALEPALQQFNSLSISYGYICPALSRAIVRYQDPDKPSHHRADLGAAADIILHEHVQQEGDEGAPIYAAFEIASLGIPFSRIITYSESPSICVAVSAEEVAAGKPRKAFYENRYEGTPKVKPKYIQMPTDAARNLARTRLEASGLPVDWYGAGHPTHHGGGYRQRHHIRVSKHTVMSDWMKHAEFMPYGNRMMPPIAMPEVLEDKFAAAGILYDMLIEWTGYRRFTISAGYAPESLENEIDCKTPWNSDEPSFSFRVCRPAFETVHDASLRISDTLEELAEVEVINDDEIEVTVHNLEAVFEDYSG